MMKFQKMLAHGGISCSLFDSLKFHELTKILLFRPPDLSRDPFVLLFKVMTIPFSGLPSLIFQK